MGLFFTLLAAVALALTLLPAIIHAWKTSAPPPPPAETTPRYSLAVQTNLLAWQHRFARAQASKPPAAHNPAATLHLESGDVDPRRSAANTPMAHARASARGLPYLVQFQGPVQAAWLEQAAQAGAIQRGYIPDHAFLMEMSGATKARLQQFNMVKWIGEYLPDYKLSPFLQYLAKHEAPEARVSITIQTFAPGDVPLVSQALGTWNAPMLDQAQGKRWGLARTELPLAKLAALARLPEIQWIEEYVAPRLLNDFAVRTNHLNAVSVWQTHGLTGAGQIIGHADTGLDLGTITGIHPDFAGRVLAAYALGRPNNWSDTDGHGTHTAGSILGSGTGSSGQFRGVAYAAQLVHQSVMDNYGGLGGLPADLNDLFWQTYTNGARIHSDSWGSSVYGAYTADSRQCDEFMWDHPDMLLVFSAGNDGADANQNGVVDPDSMGSPATAKNLLAVGASENDRAPGTGGYTARTYGNAWPWDYPVPPLSTDLISQSADLVHQGAVAFSSRGPTDDGRIKPDILAPGSDIISCRSRAPGAGVGWGAYESNTLYTFMGGTSMACPLMAGAAALARQYCVQNGGISNPSAALVKAVLLAGARSLTPGQHGTGQYREIPALPRPNSVEGWGQADLGHSLFPAPPVYVALLDNLPALSTGATNIFSFMSNGGAPLTVLLAYTDYPATAGSGKKLVNDLDLRVIAPDNTIYYSRNAAEPDHTNNVEGVDIATAMPGAWRVEVTGHNIPQGPQLFALVLRGPISIVPTISHTPLENMYQTNQAFTIDAEITSPTYFDTNSIYVLWNQTGAATGFHSNLMVRASNHLFRGFIPASGGMTSIYYYIQAGAPGAMAVHPEGAPASLHRFNVTRPFHLMVAGNPSDLLAVSPAYGITTYASGNTVRAWATPDALVAPGKRVACAGWTGAGDVPPWGTTQALEFIIRRDSALTWQWQMQFALFQFSSPDGLLAETNWWPFLVEAQSLAAPLSRAALGTNYYFCHWLLDGRRVPDDVSVADNPATGILMYAAHNCLAVYLPEYEDANGNGLADWWEQYYFGFATVLSNADVDGDGFVNYLEFADRTHPRDATSFPRPPVIQHTPLANPATTPAPWTVSAIITDNFRVAEATLYWQRNVEGWQQTPMTPGASGGLFSASIPAPGTDQDTFIYRIEAQDPAGLRATNGTYGFGVQYPILGIATQYLATMLPAATTTSLWLQITNSGSGPLTWSLQKAPVGFSDPVEIGTNGWTHGGQRDLWHITRRRYTSFDHSWYCGNGTVFIYSNSMNAWLQSPPILLGNKASLALQHWAKMEYDTDQMDDHFWDGSVVEISTNAGTTFAVLTPVGGYPFRITDNPASPFAPETPCLAGTGGWQQVTFDLSGYGGREVCLRFRFGSDGYVVDEGWFLDDFAVQPQTATYDWFAAPRTSGVLAGFASTNIEVWFDSTPLEPAGSASAAHLLQHNAPTHIPAIVVALENASCRVSAASEGPGSISPAGTFLVLRGSDTNFLVAASNYYHISQLLTNETAAVLPAYLSFTNLAWTNISSNLTLFARFAPSLATNQVPLWWLAQYGLTNANPDAEALADQDADGMLTWQECQADTIPTSAASAAMVAYVERHPADSTALLVRWLSFTNLAYDYHIATASNLVDGFNDWPESVAGTPPYNLITTRLDQAHQFYRIEKEP